MSIQVMTLVFGRLCGSPTEKIVLLAMADHADDDGSDVRPSAATLAAKCDVTRETVFRTWKKLERKGLISKVGKKAVRGGAVTVWQLNLEAISELPKPGDILSLSDTQSREVVTEDHASSDRESPKPSENRPKEPSTLVGSHVEIFWDAAPPSSRKRSSKKKLLAALKALPKSIDLARVATAWSNYLSDPKTQRDNFEYVPAVDRWLRDHRFEAWMPAEVNLLSSVELGDAVELARLKKEREHAEKLDFFFEALAKYGTWDGDRHGLGVDPRSPDADYPAELHAKHNITKMERAS